MLAQTAPIPSTFSGFAKLSVDEWIALGPLITSTLLLLTLLAGAMTSKDRRSEWCEPARGAQARTPGAGGL